MNIWVEFWKKDNTPSLNNHAQMRENAKWVKVFMENKKRYGIGKSRIISCKKVMWGRSC